MRSPAFRRLAPLVFAGVAFVSPALSAAGAPASGTSASGAPVEAPAPRYLLRYRFTPGESVHYELVNKSEIITAKGEVTEVTSHESVARKHYRVVSADAAEGTGTLETKIDHVRMSVRFGDAEPMSVDSSAPGDCHPAYQGVLATVGKPLVRITVGANGRFLKADRLLSPELQAAVAVSGNEAATPDTDASKNFLLVFPEEAVAVGESWQDEFTARVTLTRALTQNVTLRRTYTLESVRDGKATIRQKTVLITPVRDPAVLGQLIQRTPQGTIEFDLERGVIVSRRLTIDKTEIGAIGPDSSLRAVSEWTERLATPARTSVEPRKTMKE